ncbi:unnamed protein product [Lymnaea stagnalis]|uniref:H-type lectin domain-containing protein n=1 Tax=Lymnaea stagnalis TaxID=6523 RepID=A0AAV2ICQ8_LYMST
MSASWVICVLALFSLMETGDSADTVLTIDARPSLIHPVLTKKLQLRCSVKNEGWLAKNVGKFPFNSNTSTQPPKYGSGNHGVNFDVSALAPKIAHTSTASKGSFVRLLSVVITKFNDETEMRETVASVTGCDVPITEDKFLSTVEVEGSSEGSDKDGEMGYLLLTWDRPVDRHAGNFTCEAYGLRSDKHPESLKASLEIVAVEPKISDLVDYISINEKAITALKEKIITLDEENDALRQDLNATSANTTNLENRLGGVKGQNIQKGTLSCMSSNEIQFPKPFKVPPIVIISLAYTSVSGTVSGNVNYGASFSASFSVSLNSVKNTSFTYSCSNSYFSPSFNWLAIDN